MDWKNIPVSKDLYDPMYDNEADHYESPKCNNECGSVVDIEGDVCSDCYDAE